MTDAIVGGVLLGCGTVWLMASIGRVAGISGMIANALTQPFAARYAVLFVVGLGAGGYLAQAIVGLDVVRDGGSVGLGLLVGGFLVGLGTKLGSGCTSGHGICGVARLSRRSLVATATFMATGIVTATVAAL